jgi:hypothetical protein
MYVSHVWIVSTQNIHVHTYVCMCAYMSVCLYTCRHAFSHTLARMHAASRQRLWVRTHPACRRISLRSFIHGRTVLSFFLFSTNHVAAKRNKTLNDPKLPSDLKSEETVMGSVKSEETVMCSEVAVDTMGQGPDEAGASRKCERGDAWVPTRTFSARAYTGKPLGAALGWQYPPNEEHAKCATPGCDGVKLRPGRAGSVCYVCMQARQQGSSTAAQTPPAADERATNTEDQIQVGPAVVDFAEQPELEDLPMTVAVIASTRPTNVIYTPRLHAADTQSPLVCKAQAVCLGDADQDEALAGIYTPGIYMYDN